MLAIGMVASFLTGNLTVGFVLGVLFNAPLAFAGSADVILQNPNVTSTIGSWSIASQFRDFSRGVVSLSSVAYFLGIVALMLYLCMVLIGRRHWRGGQEGRGVATHYFVRFLALLLVVTFDRRLSVAPQSAAGRHHQRGLSLAVARHPATAQKDRTPTRRSRSTPTSATTCPRTTSRPS